MALFPAFTDAGLSADVPPESWLENSSFQIQLFKQPDTLTSYNPSKNDNRYKKKSSSKVHKKSNKKILESPSCSNDVFCIDKKSTKEFQTVKTISRPSVAKYKIHYYMFNKTREKNASFKRYFKHVILKHPSCEKEIYGNILFDKMPDTALVSSDFDSCKAQEELLQTTTFYNRSLTDEPNNVEMWLKFIDFQDMIFKSEKSFKKGSFAKALRTNAERKLNILEKALFHNTHSENLHRKRLQIMVSVYPADELQKQLKQLLEKDSGNIILWQGYIEATQCSMSHCNTVSVLNLYITCLSTLHKLKRNTSFDNGTLEESILRILHQCGLFLKQSGLFERLWTLLKMYLEINLGQLIQNSFNIPTNSNEKQVLELEDSVFKSQLPRHELWLRIEKLRELCHWLPVTEDCPDPQRIIFTNDVFELIQPITMPENMFRLIVTILTILKIPLLPCRHNTIQELGLDHVPWALDSIETILPIFYEIYPVNLQSFLIDFQLVVGPQYLKVLPGQEEYLNFILIIMQKCIDCLQGKDKSSLIIWWLRFQRLLIILNNTGSFKMPANIRKNIKSNVKSLLKKSENRNNAILYTEYALLEKEMASHNNCIQILQIALSFIKHQTSSTQSTHLEEEQVAKCYLIRTLVETMICMENIDKALKYLVNFVLGNSFTSECDLNETTLKQASFKFEHLTFQFVAQLEFEKLPPVEHFMPVFFCDWVICNGWFIYFTKSPLECATYLERILEKLNNRTTEKLLHKEIIYEFYLVVMFKSSMHCSGKYKTMDNVLNTALQSYPNNLFLLSAVAKRQYMLKSLGPKWWGTKTLLLNSGHALPVLVLIFATYQIMINGEQQFVDLLTGAQIDTDHNSFKFKMLSLFKEATKADMCTRRCGLVWRLYLQFVHKYFDTKLCRQVYYSAVEECPWLKALYIDAAVYIPAELGQVQDLLIEKQLRIHITPEELDILCD